MANTDAKDEAPRTIAGQTAAWRIARLVAERNAVAEADGLPPPRHGAHARAIGVSVRTLHRALRWTATQPATDPDADSDYCRVMLERLQETADTLHQTIQRRASDDRRGAMNELVGAVKAEIALADAIRTYGRAAGHHAGTVNEYALLHRRHAQDDVPPVVIDPPAMWPDLEADRRAADRQTMIDRLLAFSPPVRLTLLAAAVDDLTGDLTDYGDLTDDPDAIVEQLSDWITDAAMMAEVMPADADLETAFLRTLAAKVRLAVGIEDADAGDG